MSNPWAHPEVEPEETLTVSEHQSYVSVLEERLDAEVRLNETQRVALEVAQLALQYDVASLRESAARVVREALEESRAA